MAIDFVLPRLKISQSKILNKSVVVFIKPLAHPFKIETGHFREGNSFAESWRPRRRAARNCVDALMKNQGSPEKM